MQRLRRLRGVPIKISRDPKGSAFLVPKLRLGNAFAKLGFASSLVSWDRGAIRSFAECVPNLTVTQAAVAVVTARSGRGCPVFAIRSAKIVGLRQLNTGCGGESNGMPSAMCLGDDRLPFVFILPIISSWPKRIKTPHSATLR